MATTGAADPVDRLGFALCVALAVHALVIFGVGFAALEPKPLPARLEVTLSKRSADKAPKQADFIAQHNQQGSGTLDTAANQASPHQGPMDDMGARPTLEVQPRQQQDAHNAPVLTASRSPRRLSAEQLIDMIAERDVGEQIAILERSLEIASLESRFDTQQQLLAKKPRIHRLTSVSARSAADAEYLLYWQNRIERIGNLNYPAASRRKQVYGELLLLVAIRADGSLRETRVLKSSGHALLDDAAVQIVQLSAPFAAFPESLRQEADELEIIRTWRFRKDRVSARD